MEELMPPPLNLGQQRTTTMAHAMLVWENWKKDPKSDARYVMGFRLPSWQRGLVWTTDQKIKFLESAWLGINIGTYAYNQTLPEDPLDMLLIDGQQRMHALECYLNDDFDVFGYYWSELTAPDYRRFKMTTVFGCYITETSDEQYLRNYYNLTNFGGTPHKKSERA